MRRSALDILTRAALAVLVLGPAPVFAEITATPVDPYELRDGDSVYYAGGVPVTLTGLLDSKAGYEFFDLQADIDSDTARNEVILFDISSSTSAADFNAGGNQLLLVAFAEYGDDNFKPIPIAVAGAATGGTPGDCNTSTCSKVFAERSGTGTDLYFAANFTPGQTLRIGFYPDDLCYGVSRIESPDRTIANGCEDAGAGVGTVKLPGPGDPTEFKLRFAIGVFDVANQELRPTVSDGQAKETSDTIAATFQIDEPTFSCPEPIYFPGDGQILVNPDAFGATAGGGAAPVDAMVVVAAELPAGTLRTDATWASNEIVERLEMGEGEQGVDGFKNSTSSETHTYGVAVNFRNAAGIMDSAFQSCGYQNGVQTASIRGFLQESNCFIATAAFQSGDAAPVRMLREFRDRVLARFEAGRWFIFAYYTYGPRAAEWLLDHPVFRRPVLLALAPVQAMAWLTLNPLAGAVGLALFSVGLGAALLLMRRRFVRAVGGAR